MPLIKPFRGLRPAPGRADEVIAPPYDVLNSAEAKARAAGKPWSFLHISKPEIDLPEGTDPYSPAVYAMAAKNLDHMVAAGILIRDEAPCYYAYRILWNDHVQTGLVAAASIADYDVNRIRKHEYTRPDKEDDRVRQITAVNAETGPVLMAYPAAPDIDAIIDGATKGEAAVDAVADDGIRHTLWVIDDAATIARLSTAFDALPALYIADGHHRSASASRVSAARATLEPSPEASHRHFLAVAFPDHQLMILDYNRVVRDLGHKTPDEFLEEVGHAFAITPESAAVSPTARGEFGMYMDGQWYRLVIRPNRIPSDPVGRLDVSLLHNNLIAPMLGISDPRRDKRIDFVGGMRGLSELEKRVDSGEMVVAFSMHPTSMEDLMRVADADEVMPPKSTWFEPKLADGMVSHVLD